MADFSQFYFSLQEVAEALVKARGLREGRWMIGVEFNTVIGTLGTGPEDTAPGALLRIPRMLLTRVPDDDMGNPLAVDAGKTNAAEGASRKRKTKSTSA